MEKFNLSFRLYSSKRMQNRFFLLHIWKFLLQFCKHNHNRVVVHPLKKKETTNAHSIQKRTLLISEPAFPLVSTSIKSRPQGDLPFTTSADTDQKKHGLQHGDGRLTSNYVTLKLSLRFWYPFQRIRAVSLSYNGYTFVTFVSCFCRRQFTVPPHVQCLPNNLGWRNVSSAVVNKTNADKQVTLLHHK